MEKKREIGRKREEEHAREASEIRWLRSRRLPLLNVSSSSEAGQASMHALEKRIVPVHFWMRCLMSRNAITESLSYFLCSDKVLGRGAISNAIESRIEREKREREERGVLRLPRAANTKLFSAIQHGGVIDTFALKASDKSAVAVRVRASRSCRRVYTYVRFVMINIIV